MREVPLTERLYAILKNRAQMSRVVFTWNEKALVDLKTSWKTAQGDAEIAMHYPFHDLRHSFATRLMEAA